MNTKNRNRNNENVRKLWAQADGFYDLYKVSDHGDVQEIGKKHYVKHVLLNGVPSVMLYKGNKKFIKSVHRLMMTSFYEVPDGLKQIRHNNGNVLDNRLDNLSWVLPKDKDEVPFHLLTDEAKAKRIESDRLRMTVTDRKGTMRHEVAISVPSPE